MTDMNRKENTIKAIHFDKPDYVPIIFINKDKEQSDLIMIDIVKQWMGEKKDRSEWGFEWERSDETMGQFKDIL